MYKFKAIKTLTSYVEKFNKRLSNKDRFLRFHKVDIYLMKNKTT